MQGDSEGIENRTEETSEAGLEEGTSMEAVDEAEKEDDAGGDDSEEQNQAKLHENLPPAVVAIIVTKEGYCLLPHCFINTDKHLYG